MSIYGNMVGGGSGFGKTFIIEDADGNEFTGVVVDKEVVFTATDNDVREGLVYASDAGVSTGTKVIPSYHTRESARIITPGSAFTIPFSDLDRYDYTSLQCIICPLNTDLSDSVAAEKIVLLDCVYPVQSTVSISNIVKDDTTKSIILGITNDTEISYVLRYFTYKEIY